VTELKAVAEILSQWISISQKGLVSGKKVVALQEYLSGTTVGIDKDIEKGYNKNTIAGKIFDKLIGAVSISHEEHDSHGPSRPSRPSRPSQDDQLIPLGKAYNFFRSPESDPVKTLMGSTLYLDGHPYTAVMEYMVEKPYCQACHERERLGRLLAHAEEHLTMYDGAMKEATEVAAAASAVAEGDKPTEEQLGRLNLAFSRADTFHYSATTVLRALASASKGTSGGANEARQLIALLDRKDRLDTDKITIDRLHQKFQTRIDEHVAWAGAERETQRLIGDNEARQKIEAANRPQGEIPLLRRRSSSAKS